MAHSKHSPSKAHRWMHCPGSVALEAQAPDQEPSEYAKEGSAAHALSEASLLGVLSAIALTQAQGRKLKDVIGLREEDKYLAEVVVTEEMIDCVQQYVLFVKSQLPAGISSLNREYVVVEGRVGINDELSGTADCIINDPFDTLHVIDLKYGQGVQVEAVDNPQLAIYGLGALACFGMDFEQVKLTIFQPRGKGDTVKTWTITPQDLLKTWGKKIERAYQETIDKPRLYRQGDWCMWCKGARNCDPVERQTKAIGRPNATVPKEVKKLAKILRMETAVLEYLNQAKAEAFALLSQGVEVPGYKLVQAWGNRKWVDEDQVRDLLSEQCGEAEYMTKKLKSPAQLEKQLRKSMPNTLAQLGPHITRPNNGLKLVPETDKREAVSSVQQDFGGDNAFDM